MDYLSGVIQNVSKFAANINTSTLSGAIDIVFVRQPDGRYRSTPFFIKFGKIGVLKAKEKVIYIEVNGKEIARTMILADNGVAYFQAPQDNETSNLFDLDLEQSIGTRRVRHKSEPSECSTPESETLKNLSIASRALSNPNLENEEDQALELAGLTRTISDPSLEEEEECNLNELTLTEEELEEFNLKLGMNEAEFSVTTQYQGTTRCCCSIFVWEQIDKIIISDIDGTITRSDVRGMILPLIGVADWAQDEVTKLFSKICGNGYKILYLSARSISQAGATRDYLRGLQQGSLNLPHGPLFLNPESVFRAFKKEVIDRKPEIFKISCLRRLQRLFYNGTPFFAGYGNRPNDIIAYESVGIPKSRIFIINKVGELKGSLSETMQTSYKTQSKLVDLYFPPINSAGTAMDLSYWSLPMPDLHDLPDLT